MGPLKRLSATIVLGAAALAASPAVALAAPLDDATILAIFDNANMADIRTARLGVEKAHSAEVRALAKMVAADHEAVQQMGRDLAHRLGLIPTPPDGDASVEAEAKALAALQVQSGPAFDRAYLLHEIAFHQGVIDAIRGTLLPAIADPDLKALVVKVLPGFEHHLAETKATALKLGVNS